MSLRMPKREKIIIWRKALGRVLAGELEIVLPRETWCGRKKGFVGV